MPGNLVTISQYEIEGSNISFKMQVNNPTTVDLPYQAPVNLSSGDFLNVTINNDDYKNNEENKTLLDIIEQLEDKVRLLEGDREYLEGRLIDEQGSI